MSQHSGDLNIFPLFVSHDPLILNCNYTCRLQYKCPKLQVYAKTPARDVGVSLFMGGVDTLGIHSNRYSIEAIRLLVDLGQEPVRHQQLSTNSLKHLSNQARSLMLSMRRLIELTRDP